MVNTRTISLLSLLLLFVTTSLHALVKRSNDEYQWKAEQVKIVIDQKTALMLDSWIDHLFKPEKAEDIQTIRSILYSGILDNPDYFADKTYAGQVLRLYSKTRVPQVIYSATLDYISDKAYKYAFEQLASHELATIVKALATKDVSERMGATCNSEPDLSMFLGRDLKIKIDNIIDQRGWLRAGLELPKPQSAPAAIDLQCQSGLDDAKTGKPCIRSTLTQGKPLPINPCGHAPICLSCAKQYVAHGVKACPVCNSAMDVDDFRTRVAALAQAVQDATVAAEKRAAA